MTFNEKHGSVVEKYKARTREFKTALPFDQDFLKAMEPEELLVYTGRIYPCSCGTPTGWRDISAGIEVMICSDECRAQLWERMTAPEDSLSEKQTPTKETQPC